MKLILLVISLLFLPLVMQGQDVWTPNDSLKLKKMLEGKTEIQINKEALNELGKAQLIKLRTVTNQCPLWPFSIFLCPNIMKLSVTKMQLCGVLEWKRLVRRE